MSDETDTTTVATAEPEAPRKRAADKAVKTATRGLSEICEAERQLVSKVAEISAGIEAMVPSVGDEILTALLSPDVDTDEAHARISGDVDGAQSRLISARRQVESLRAAIGAARGRREVAIRRLRQARGAALRSEAKDIRRKAERRQHKTDELIAQLLEYEGCHYRPIEPNRPLLGDLEFRVITRHIPITEGMRRDAQRLEVEASTIESAPVLRDTCATFYSADELLAWLYADPECILAEELEVRSWIAAKTAQADDELRKALEGERGKEYPATHGFIAYHLEVTDSAIVPAVSSIRAQLITSGAGVPDGVEPHLRTLDSWS